MEHPLQRFRHIAIEGPIGAGKTTLARKLAAAIGAELLLEAPLENPFLERFYADPPGYALQVQLAFLFQRVKQVQPLSQRGMFGPPLVSDYLFAKDALFARLNLSDDEHRLYTSMYTQVAPQLPAPDLVLWLQASPPALLSRIRRRGIGMEQGIEVDYLQRLCDAYVEFFHSYTEAPLFVLGTEHFNAVDNDGDFVRLVDRLAGFRGPREFFHAHVELPLG